VNSCRCLSLAEKAATEASQILIAENSRLNIRRLGITICNKIVDEKVEQEVNRSESMLAHDYREAVSIKDA